MFSADFQARSYPGVALACATPLVGPEPSEVLIRAGHTKAAVHLFMEHPSFNEFIDRLATRAELSRAVRIMRDEMIPWLHDYTPGVAIGETHTTRGFGRGSETGH